jgi:hypothetical protein
MISPSSSGRYNGGLVVAQIRVMAELAHKRVSASLSLSHVRCVLRALTRKGNYASLYFTFKTLFTAHVALHRKHVNRSANKLPIV